MSAAHYQIEIADQQELLTIDSAELEAVVRDLLEVEQVRSADLSLAIVDNETIWELNRRYLCHDYPTDVLSFLLDETGDEDVHHDVVEDGDKTLMLPRGRRKHIDGELIVSAEMAMQTADKYGWTPRAELILYVIHGTLHLCGYDDQNEREREIIRARERDMLGRWQITPGEDLSRSIHARD